ncbi:MAG: hypothetical protein IPL83_16730 [Bdellovibrionales bacterium]|nr:hypothetical protein [Bdellovibrionales bacterium]
MKKMLFLALAVIGGCFMVNFQASALRRSDSPNTEPRRLQPGEAFLACYTTDGTGYYHEQLRSILWFLNWHLNGKEINVYPYTLVGSDQNDDGSYKSTERKGDPVIVREPYRVEYMQPTFPDKMPLFCAVIKKI